MLELTKGNLLEADAEALVNTVNTVGIIGKRIALQFRLALPRNHEIYRSACKRGEVVPGKMFVVPTSRLDNPKFIVNFPPKRHWKGKSRIEDIHASLLDLVRYIRQENTVSIAVPPLGCGNGGLSWRDIRSGFCARSRHCQAFTCVSSSRPARCRLRTSPSPQ
jgi:O-acetyl-ADP-ribose deacetylase (regulator of RNase III)